MKNNHQNTTIYQNGHFVKTEESKLNPIKNWSFDGLVSFETLRAYKTHNAVRIFKAKEHVERLKRTCALAGIAFNWSITELIAESYKLLQHCHLKDAYIYIMVKHTGQMQSELTITAEEWEADLGSRALKMTTSTLDKYAENQYAGMLHISKHAKRNGYDEALLIDANGYIIQTAHAYIAIEKDNALYTPFIENEVPDITRKTVFELCDLLDIQLIDKEITIDELAQAESVFLYGTTTEITPVAAINETYFPLKWHDSLGATLQRAYKNLVLEKINYEVII